MSELFLSDEASSSPSGPGLEARDGGEPGPCPLDQPLATAAALRSRFESLVSWFKTFEGARAREASLGLELATELCGCYDAVLRRLLDGVADTFLGKAFVPGPRYVARADRVLAALADIAEDRVGRPSLSSALMELEATLSRQTSVRDALALLLAPSSTEAAADIICSSYVRRKWGLVTDVGWALLDTIRDLRDGLDRETERCERALRGEAEAKRALASEERERKMWRVDGRIQEERMKHEDELRIVRQSSRKDIDELQTQMAGILIGHAKQKDVLQEKNLTLQKALEEMANELRTSQERCAGTQDELDRCKRTLQEAEEESARCRENAAKLDAQRAEMEGLIREQNKREHALVEERDATSHRVVQLQRALHEIRDFVGLDASSGFAVDDIRALMDRSFERVKRTLLRDCVRKTVPEDGSGEDGDHVASMDTGGSSDLFHEYESMIRQTVRTLDAEHSPMEYDDSCHDQFARGKRRYRTGMKRRNPREAKDERGVKGEHESRDLRPSTSSSTTPTKLPKVEKAKEPIDAAVPVREERASVKRETDEGLDYTHIHKITIDSSPKSMTVPRAVYDHLGSPDVKFIRLGSSGEFINTLFEVLQVNNVTDVCGELNTALLASGEQGLRQLSEALRCTLVVFQSQSGRADVYGEDSATRIHAIFIQSGNYYMIVARRRDSDDSAYTYNLARLPEFHMPKRDRATEEEEEKYSDNQWISADKAVAETSEITLLQPET